MVTDYNSFLENLLAAGFSMGGGNSEGIHAVIPWNWNQEPPYDTPVRWHTGDPETDPWEWRMRVLDERRDIAYAKLFFKKADISRKNGTHSFCLSAAVIRFSARKIQAGCLARQPESFMT